MPRWLATSLLGAAIAVAGLPCAPVGAEPPDAKTARRGAADTTPPPAPRRRGREREAEPESRGDARSGGRDAGGGGEVRGLRRGIETAPAPSPAEMRARETVQPVPVVTPGCSIRRMPRLVDRLLSLRQRHPVLSLEVWGDFRDYRDGQKVLFFTRVPLRSFVTLFWIGPNGDIFVAFTNVAVPAHRNAMIDPDAIIVPPLGHERWVALATLEPVPFACGAPEGAMLSYIDRLTALPHAVGRWEVFSKGTGRGR